MGVGSRWDAWQVPFHGTIRSSPDGASIAARTLSKLSPSCGTRWRNGAMLVPSCDPLFPVVETIILHTRHSLDPGHRNAKPSGGDGDPHCPPPFSPGACLSLGAGQSQVAVRRQLLKVARNGRGTFSVTDNPQHNDRGLIADGPWSKAGAQPRMGPALSHSALLLPFFYLPRGPSPESLEL